MEDLDKIKVAREWILKLANGINPLNDEPLEENDVVNNVHISRCLFFVSEILDSSQRKKKKTKYDLDFQLTASLKEDVAIHKESGINNFVREINSHIPENMKPLASATILKWLVNKGYMKLVEKDSHTSKYPTGLGMSIGITTDIRRSTNGIDYTAVLYDSEAQKFILEHLDEMIEL